MRAVLPPWLVVERGQDVRQVAHLWWAIARRTRAASQRLQEQAKQLRADIQTYRQVQEAMGGEQHKERARGTPGQLGARPLGWEARKGPLPLTTPQPDAKADVTQTYQKLELLLRLPDLLGTF